MTNIERTTEARQLVRKYRDLLDQTKRSRSELADPETNKLSDLLEQGDQLQGKLKRSREAAIDSEFVVASSDILIEQARKLHPGFRTYSIPTLISKLVAKHRKTDGPPPEDGPVEINWDGLGKEVRSCFRTASVLDVMLGPLQSEAKERKTPRQRKPKQAAAPLVNPSQVQDPSAGERTETSTRVQTLMSCLEKESERGRRTDMFHFFVNPQSFSQTVENCFDLAFAAKEGTAAIRLDDKGIPFVRKSDMPQKADYDKGLRHKQCVVKLNMSIFKELIDGFDIQRSVVPHRQPLPPQQRSQRTSPSVASSSSVCASRSGAVAGTNNDSGGSASTQRTAATPWIRKPQSKLAQAAIKQPTSDDEDEDEDASQERIAETPEPSDDDESMADAPPRDRSHSGATRQTMMDDTADHDDDDSSEESPLTRNHR